jgi:hypothetical protein
LNGTSVIATPSAAKLNKYSDDESEDVALARRPERV